MVAIVSVQWFFLQIFCVLIAYDDLKVNMTAALVSHLVRQGRYQSDDIAVITRFGSAPASGS